MRDAELSLDRFKISDELERSRSGATVSEDEDGNQRRAETRESPCCPPKSLDFIVVLTKAARQPGRISARPRRPFFT